VNFKALKFFILIFALQISTEKILAAGETDFRAGVAAYEAGQFDSAAQAFRDSLAKKPAAGTLLNLGLAEWQRGNTGDAILAWQQAAWLDPFDGNAQKNLLYARESASVNAPDLKWFEQASAWLPANFWTVIASGSLWLAVALVTLPGFFRWRKAGWHQTVAALALGVFLLTLAPSVGIFTRAKIMIVTEKNTSLRLTPTQSAEIISSLPPGEPVRALRERGNYFFVRTQNGNGWVGRGQVAFLCPK
jgi:tetratricopeptide (TPR) repeat protein